MTDTKREAPASLEKRAAALEIVLRRKADMPKNFVAELTEHADDAWIAANGAQMVVGGDLYADALAASQAWTRESSAFPVHAFDKPETLLGQGTVALELERQAPLDTLLVAVGGGGLIAASRRGTAAA
jgi:threonine dehydratase